MCLAKAYMKGKDGELLLEDIAHLQINGERVRLETLFGEEKVVTGKALEIDFSSSKITIDEG